LYLFRLRFTIIEGNVEIVAYESFTLWESMITIFLGLVCFEFGKVMNAKLCL